MSLYIFHPSEKSSSEYLPLTYFLSTGRVFNLGVMLMGSIYHILNQYVWHDPIFKLEVVFGSYRYGISVTFLA